MKMMNILMFVLIVIALVIAIAATVAYKKQSKATTKDDPQTGEKMSPTTEVSPLTTPIVIGLWVGFATLALSSYMTGAIWLILAIVAVLAYGVSAYLAAQPNPNFAEEVKEDE